MTEEVVVHVGRDGGRGLDVPDGVEVTDRFDVRFVNHGTPLHVHLHLDDSLSAVATVDATNHYVEGEAERVVPVEVAPDREESVFGRLKVVSGYGAQTRWVDVDLQPPPDPEAETVEVDESLAEPAPRPAEDGGGSVVGGRPTLVVGAVGLVALGLAVGVALSVGNPVVVVGAAVVVVGVVVALGLVLG